MEEKLKSAIERFQKAPTSLEAYKAISDFVKIVITVPEYIARVEENSENVLLSKFDLYIDKANLSKEHIAKKQAILHQIDPLFPLRNLHTVYLSLQPEHFDSACTLLFKGFNPDDPMPKADKEEYQLLLDKVYKGISPFLKTEATTEPAQEMKVKFYDEEKRTLAIGNFTIIIAKNEGNNNAHEIMAYIFLDKIDDSTAKFYYAEIAEKRFEDSYNSKNKYAHQPYSGACKRINDKVKDETNGLINDFLIFNHSTLGYVRVNPKYL